MTVLFDTDVLVAFLNHRDGRHETAAHMVREISSGRWGTPLITDYVLDEALTLLMARGAGLAAADRLLSMVAAKSEGGAGPRLLIWRVDESVFSEAILLFRRHFARGLSFTDCTTLALVGAMGVDFVASFDHGFDGLVSRVSA